MIFPFENDTRAVIGKIAAAKLKHGKLKKRISIVAIAMAAMLMSTVLLLISGIVAVNRNGGNNITGSYHALISEISREQFENIRRNEQVTLSGVSAFLGSSKIENSIMENSIIENSRLNISYSNPDALTLNGLSVAEGRMPERENEILIEKDYLDHLEQEAGIGDTVSVINPATGEETEFIISGYLKTAAGGTERTLYAAVVSEQYFIVQGGWETLLPAAMIRVAADGTAVKADIEKTVTDVMKSAGIEKKPSINEAYINLSKPSALMIGIAVAGLTVIIAAGVLVIYCIFYIAILNSIREYGQLRTIGMTGRQMRTLVFREGGALSVKAIPIGLAAGTVLSSLLIPQGFRPASLLWILPLVTLLTYMTVRLSIRKPAMIAAEVSPIEACRCTESCTGKEKVPFRTKKISPFMLAQKQISNHRKRNVLTVASLIITGILLLGAASVLSSINAEEMSRSGFPRGQFIVNMSNEELRNHSLEEMQAANPFTEELKNALAGVMGVEVITEYHYLPVSAEPEVGESDAAIVGFGRADMELIQSCAPNETVVDYDELTAGNRLIIGRPDDLEKDLNIRAEAGQIISLKVFDGRNVYDMDFEIGAVLDQSRIGGNGDKIDMLMLSLDSMNSIADSNTMFQYAVRVSDDAEQQAETEIEQILKEAPELSVTTQAAAIAQNENFLQAMRMALITAVVLIGSFAVMNLVNTILTGITTRRKEFAVMRSVGMSRKQLSSMVCCESAIIIAAGLFLSVFIGGSIGNILCIFLKNRLMSYLNYHFPFGITVSYCFIVILCTLAVTKTALKHQEKASLIEQLRTIE